MVVKIRKLQESQRRNSRNWISAQCRYFILLWEDLRWQVCKRSISALLICQKNPKNLHMSTRGSVFYPYYPAVTDVQVQLESFSIRKKGNDEISVSSFNLHTSLNSWAATLPFQIPFWLFYFSIISLRHERSLASAFAPSMDGFVKSNKTNPTITIVSKQWCVCVSDKKRERYFLEMWKYWQDKQN